VAVVGVMVLVRRIGAIDAEPGIVRPADRREEAA
jgi:hypothetical protein